MAIIRFRVKSQDLLQAEDVYDWRVMQNALMSIADDNYKAIRVCTLTKTIIIMGMTQQALINLNKRHRSYISENTVFSEQYSYQPGPCMKCRGAGKLDWVNRITGVPFLSWRERTQMYSRDPDHVLWYEPVNAISHPHYSNMETVFSRTTLGKGEVLCNKCHGIGLELDGRLKMFPNMPKMRNRIRVVEANHYDFPD